MKRTVSTQCSVVLLACAGVMPAFNASHAAAITPSVTGDAVAAAIGDRINFAAAANGGVAFSSSDLGPAYAYDRLNDGVIDNSGNSWIPATTGTAEFAGVRFETPYTVAAVVFSGQIGYNGRSAGTWSLQYTTDPEVQTTTAWTEIGAYVYTEPAAPRRCRGRCSTSRRWRTLQACGLCCRTPPAASSFACRNLRHTSQ